MVGRRIFTKKKYVASIVVEAEDLPAGQSSQALAAERVSHERRSG